MKNLTKLASIVFLQLFRRSSPFCAVEDKKAFLESLPEPRDNLERAYFQYLCQEKFVEPSRQIAKNIVCVPGFIYTLIRVLLPFRKKEGGSTADAVAIMDCDFSVVPEALAAQYRHIDYFRISGEWFCDLTSRCLIRDLVVRYWRFPYFCLKSIVKILRYAYLAERYDCHVIICSAEYSFTSSVLTEFCRRSGIAHINVMHGEKFYDIQDAFCHFSEFHIWDCLYEDLFKKLRCKSDGYRVSRPKWLAPTRLSNVLIEYELTYYLGWEKCKKDLVAIKASLDIIKGQGGRVCVRKHPCFGNMKWVREVFEGYDIEDPIEVTLQMSLSKTAAVVSLYSTIFHQALFMGLSIIIDDVSNRDDFLKLRDLDYVFIEKSCGTLSGLCSERESIVSSPR